ncbi:maleylpyruvate isomerase N-terminal domain-containing protein [Kitasatospora sp. LaBMicrA B282]|uniref:maleylpyruvate isomerase N-terminal domain-containing protein n=1 Tax=Kitasatospora sp. LaBMicrA B282 TaxID=3420949 RepID=UPI003D0F362F
MGLTDAYLAAAEQAVAQLAVPELTAAWERPSALAELTVGALAGHLAYQLFSVDPVLTAEPSPVPPIPLLEHYTRAVWVGAAVDSEVSTALRAKAADFGGAGPQALADRARASLAGQRARLPELAGELPVFLPPTGWALCLDDFLVTRLVELAVHLDDLAVSLGTVAPPFPADAFEPVLTLLARLAVHRHGQAAVLRGLARVDRAPAAINAL